MAVMRRRRSSRATSEFRRSALRRIEERACAALLSAAGFDWQSVSTGAWYNLIGGTRPVSVNIGARRWVALACGRVRTGLKKYT